MSKTKGIITIESERIITRPHTGEKGLIETWEYDVNPTSEWFYLNGRNWYLVHVEEI
jgi:hypothetical protein